MTAETVDVALVECHACGAEHTESTFVEELHVCPTCGWHAPLTAHEWIAHLADPDTFKEIGKSLFSADPLHFKDQKPYKERLREAEQRTGMHEAALAGEARLEGRRVVLVSLAFDFLGGTMGSVVGERVARAFGVATRRKLPVVSILASGGARIQEGMLALMQMAKTATAVAEHQSARLPYISVLTNPSFGGTFASFGSLGDVLIGEPGAQIGFVGARVVEGTISEKIPPEERRAETLLKHGMLDMVIPRRNLRNCLAMLVTQLQPDVSAQWPTVQLAPTPKPSRTAAEVISLARLPERPRARAYADRIFSSFIELHGDRCYGEDPAIVGGIADLQGHPVVLIAQTGQVMPMPEGFRKAHRLLRLAEKFRLPVVTLVDTPGAFPGLEAEHRGIALTIGENLAALAALQVPIVNVVIGEGGSGGALALGLADIILMQENAIYSVISPEGAAAILLRDASKTDELIAGLRLRAHDLLELGIIDDIVPEPTGGSHRDADTAARLLMERIVHHLGKLSGTKPRRLVRNRAKRYQSIGKFERGIVRKARDLMMRIKGTR
jgi:acetyl-CoA carboxylase carboxyl transferase subunit beta